MAPYSPHLCQTNNSAVGRHGILLFQIDAHVEEIRLNALFDTVLEKIPLDLESGSFKVDANDLSLPVDDLQAAVGVEDRVRLRDPWVPRLDLQSFVTINESD